MHIADITPGLAFYGSIPPGSEREHLGIVLLSDQVDLCYCTSQEKIKRLFKNYFILNPDTMKAYFPNNAKESYIILHQNFIINMLCFTFVTNVSTGEIDVKEPLKNTLFNALLQQILNSDTISEKFKEELRDELHLK